MKHLLYAFLVILFFTLTLNPFHIYAQSTNTPIHFAVIGDFGDGLADEARVANLVKSWSPDFIITVGDNNYEKGLATTMDTNIGKDYHEYIGNYTGKFGAGSTVNRFFPSIGNHDWGAPNVQPHLDYFTLPNNERYYDFVKGPVHFFAIDSDSHEPDGNTPTSTQGQWLKSKLANSTSIWNIVYFHHAPYSSSSSHGSTTNMQWPFKLWGADAVLSGHDHTYERVIIDNLPYFVNGLGGHGRYTFGNTIAGSQIKYNAKFGAMQVEANIQTLTFKFINTDGLVIDSYSLNAPQQTLPSPITSPQKIGDANWDGKVDGIDYVTWALHYGQSILGTSNGDFNNSGKVDGVDYVIWALNYGK